MAFRGFVEIDGGGRMYVTNGVTTAFPLPPGNDGSIVVLISPDGDVVRLGADEYSITDGSVVFPIAPVAGWTLAFSLSDHSAADSILVIYPDGTTKRLAQDPWELLIQAKAERDEVKKLLKEAKNNLDAAERVVHVESEIAKEKLSARLEKYGSLVEDSIAQAANGAKGEILGYLGQQIEEVRTKHDETLNAREDAFRAAKAAADMAERAAANTEERVRAELEAATKQAIEAYERTRAMHSEILDFRDQAQSAAATTGAKLQEVMTSLTGAVIEQIRGLRAGAENELKAAVAKATAEVSGLTEEIRTARDSVQASAVRMLEIEGRVVELDKEQRIREEGTRATWNRIAGFKKTFDHRVLQMRGAAATEAGEGEE
jgi:hypothetical protein